MTGKDLLLLNVFLGICHSLFEDTFLFVAIGGVAWILFSSRLILAIGITYILGRWLNGKTTLEKENGLGA